MLKKSISGCYSQRWGFRSEPLCGSTWGKKKSSDKIGTPFKILKIIGYLTWLLQWDPGDCPGRLAWRGGGTPCSPRGSCAQSCQLLRTPCLCTSNRSQTQCFGCQGCRSETDQVGDHADQAGSDLKHVFCPNLKKKKSFKSNDFVNKFKLQSEIFFHLMHI